MINTHIQWYYS